MAVVGNPRQLERWWGPPTYPATFVDHDLTPGGTVTYFMTGPEGDQPRGWWRVVAVNAPHSLEFEDGFADDAGKPNQDMPTMTIRVTLDGQPDQHTYGHRDGLPRLDWARIQSRLDEGVTQAPETGGPSRHTCWLATTNRDGSPHVTGVGTLSVDGAFWFETGERTRKGANLARDPRCTLSLATRDFDLVVEGEAHKATDPQAVAAMAERWDSEGWPARVDDTGLALTADYSAPSAGPPPWVVYRVTPHRATAVATVEPGGATRWSFSGE